MRFTVQRYETVPCSDLTVERRPSVASSSIERDDETEARPPSSSLLEIPSDLGEDQLSTPDVISNSHPSSPSEDKTAAAAVAADKLAHICKSYHARKTRRLVLKDGSCNVTSGNITKRNRKFLVDIFTTLIDMKWRYNFLLFAAAFALSWTAFATLWYAIAVAHGDHLHGNDTDWQPCVANVYDFTTAILFSIETQHTIGYGYRMIEPTCPGAVLVLMVQSCFGVFIQSLVTGLIFSKLSRPKRRSHTMMFSRCAVVSKQNDEYCLLFRVGDMRKSHFVGTSIRALLVTDKNTEEGETIPLCQTPLDLKTDSYNGDNFLFLVWPATVVHRITQRSPLWRVAADSLLREQFEIIVILEGIVESTGGTAQIRTSYLPSEILWGYRLAPLMTYQTENGHYKIDYTQFHQVLPLNSMPPWSAKQNHDRRNSPASPSSPSSPSSPGTKDPDDAESTLSASANFTTVVRAVHASNVIKRMRTSIRKRALSSQRDYLRSTSTPVSSKNGAAAAADCGVAIKVADPRTTSAGTGNDVTNKGTGYENENSVDLVQRNCSSNLSL